MEMNTYLHVDINKGREAKPCAIQVAPCYKIPASLTECIDSGEPLFPACTNVHYSSTYILVDIIVAQASFTRSAKVDPHSLSQTPQPA